MSKWRCSVCGYIYDEAREGKPFEDLPDSWTCPQCGAPKSAFVKIEDEDKAGVPTVADRIVEQLVAYGVRRIYGIPGNSNLPLVDSIRRHPEIDLILVRHEEAAAFMASAHAKLTDELGVCLSIAGPGATNLITGIVDAATDRAPVLALLGQVPQPFLGSESLQEIPEVDIFKTFTVYSEMVARPSQALRVLNLAIKKAYAGPGPAALSLPTDVQGEPLEEPIWRPELHLFEQTHGVTAEIGEAVRLLKGSKRPFLFAGWGARHCGSELLELAHRIGAGIATTSRAKGIVPESDDVVLGVLGSIGNEFAPKVVARADLLVILGSGFRQRNLVPDLDMIQVDIDATRVGKTFPVRLGIVADAGVVVKELLRNLPERAIDPEYQSAIKQAVGKQRELIEADSKKKTKPIYPGAVIQALKRTIRPDAIVCCDVGDHTYWFYKRFTCEGQRTLLCANMAGMGFGLPAAIASQFAEPDRQVVALTGDGGFGMIGMEFSTAVFNKLPITVIVFNDGHLKNIGKEQDEYGFKRYRISFENPNFAEMASSAGGMGIRVEDPSDLDDALKKALSSDKPSLVDVIVDPSIYIARTRGRS